MFETLLARSVWLGMALCAAAYAGNFWLAGYEARLYLAGAKERIAYDGRYGADGSSRSFRARLPLILLVLCAAIAAVWWVTVGPSAVVPPEIYPFLIGALFLTEVADAFRHYRNAVLFKNLSQAGALQGRITFSSRLALAVDYTQLFAFAVLYLVGFLFTGSWLFAGGAVACLLTANQQWHYSITHAKLLPNEREER